MAILRWLSSSLSLQCRLSCNTDRTSYNGTVPTSKIQQAWTNVIKTCQNCCLGSFITLMFEVNSESSIQLYIGLRLFCYSILALIISSRHAYFITFYFCFVLVRTVAGVWNTGRNSAPPTKFQSIVRPWPFFGNHVYVGTRHLSGGLEFSNGELS